MGYPINVAWPGYAWEPTDIRDVLLQYARSSLIFYCPSNRDMMPTDPRSFWKSGNGSYQTTFVLLAGLADQPLYFGAAYRLPDNSAAYPLAAARRPVPAIRADGGRRRLYHLQFAFAL